MLSPLQLWPTPSHKVALGVTWETAVDATNPEEGALDPGAPKSGPGEDVAQTGSMDLDLPKGSWMNVRVNRQHEL